MTDKRRRNLLRSAAGSLGLAALYPATRGLKLFGGDSVPLVTSVRLNQVGYLPTRAKIASVVKQGSSFNIRSTRDGSIALRGVLGVARYDDASGDNVQHADFSSVIASGTYTLTVDNGDVSSPFAISTQVYDEPLRLAMRAFYGQRCGCAVALGGGYAYPKCHSEGAYHRSSGKSGPFPNHGGWHDAGDYGRYVVSSGITTGTLLWAWEMYGHDLNRLVLHIPESGGRTPDFLAEIQWNLGWMLSMQDDDGGVWHKQTSEQFCGFVMPQYDSMVSYVIGTGLAPFKSTGATANLAAVAAIAARCYGPYDDAFAQRCLAAARKAWKWCHANSRVAFTNPSGVGTGGYDDKDCEDEVLWATAELYRTTGELTYQQAFSAVLTPRLAALWISAPEWANVLSMACWTYVLSGRNPSDALSNAIRRKTLESAQALVLRAAENGYGNTLGLDDYVWGSNAIAANHSILLMMAFHFLPHQEFLRAALANLHYLLGRNCFGVSWVTHVGARPFLRPHHRPSVADHIPAPWPGLMCGGPNAHPGDPIARRFTQQPPMRMWIDHNEAYSMNEVAINWNAPLVFVLAGAQSLAG